jgi:hypothetical protein
MNEENRTDSSKENNDINQSLELLLSRIKSGSKEEDLSLSIDSIKTMNDKLYPALKERFKRGTEEDKKAIFTVFSYLNNGKYASFLKDTILKQTLGLNILQAAFHELKDIEIPQGEMIKASLPTAMEIYEEIKQMIGQPAESLTIRFAIIKDCFSQLDTLVQENFLFQFISDYQEESLPIISLLIGCKTELDAMIIDLISDIESPDTVKLLNSMMENSAEKEQKKKVKRALFKLKSKGMKTEEPEQKKNVWAPPPVSTDSKWEGYLSAIDCTGSRLVWITSPVFPRGVNMAYGVLSDLKGILDFYWGEMSKKEFKNYFKAYSEKEGGNFAIVEAPAEYCQFLFEKSRELMIKKGGNPPDDYLYWKNIIKPKKAENIKPLIYKEYSENNFEDILKLAGQTEKLHLIKEFKGWFLEPAEIKPYIDSFEDQTPGLITLTEEQKKEKLEELIKGSTEKYFNDERASVYRERLEEMAYILLKLKMEEEARLTLAAALAIEKKSVLPADHPFLRELMKKSINLILSRGKQANKPI